MDSLRSGTKSIREAVAEGSLLDVTELAKKEAGMLYPTFMSSSLAAKYESECPGGGIAANLFFYSGMLYDIGYNLGNSVYGPLISGETVCILEPHEELGLVVLILEKGLDEKIGLKRTTGDRSEFAM